MESGAQVSFTCPNCAERQPLGDFLGGSCRDCGFDLIVYDDRHEALQAYRQMRDQRGTLALRPAAIPETGQWAVAHAELALI